MARGKKSFPPEKDVGLSPDVDKKGDGKASLGAAIFPDADEFRRIADAYFDDCDRHHAVYGIAGLCLWLTNHNDKGKIVTYFNLRRWWQGESSPHLQDAVQYACLRIQDQRETGDVFLEPKMAGARNFDLKQLMMGGYTDRTEVAHEGTLKVVMKDFSEELAK